MPVAMRRDHGIPLHSRKDASRQMARASIQLAIVHSLDNDLVEMDARDLKPRHRRADQYTSRSGRCEGARSLSSRVDRRPSLLLRPLASHHIRTERPVRVANDNKSDYEDAGDAQRRPKCPRYNVGVSAPHWRVLGRPSPTQQHQSRGKRKQPHDQERRERRRRVWRDGSVREGRRRVSIGAGCRGRRHERIRARHRRVRRTQGGLGCARSRVHPRFHVRQAHAAYAIGARFRDRHHRWLGRV